METIKNVGIWINHNAAEIIDINSASNNRSVESNVTMHTLRDATKRSEHIRHNKEQQMNEAYYKEIGNEILKYEHVLLFGPTNAKSELNNYLKKDLHFKDITIDIEAADKMTDNEKVAFVRNHFDQ